MRQANKAIVRERNIMLKIKDIFPELLGICVSRKTDVREGYHQIMLHENSKHVTGFGNHKGVYRYKRYTE